MKDADRRLRAIGIIVEDVLSRGAALQDERPDPELRDIARIARGERPRTAAGKTAWKVSS